MRPLAANTLVRILAPALTLTGLLAWAGAATAGSRRVVPDPALAPAVASAGETMVAFAGRDDHAATRVHAALPADADPVELGPALPGDDGAPALVSLPDAGFLVLAARRSGAGGLLWSQRFDGRRWRRPRVLPGMDRDSHHPALARGGDRVWAVWVAGDGSGGTENILAASWTGTDWGPAELVPGAPGAPGVPSIAVDGRGRPAIVWSARDEDPDCEIWLSRRRPSGWTAPVRLTHDDVPDITPQVGFAGRTPVIAWAAFAPDGYRIRAGAVHGQDRLHAQTVSRYPGSAPRMVLSGDELRLAWSTPAADDPSVNEVRTASWRGGRFGRGVPVVRALNARVAVAPARARSWLAVWHDGVEISAAEIAPTDRGTPRMRTLRGDADRMSSSDLALVFPGSYMGFGDSITAGIVVHDDVVSLVTPYTHHLGLMISDLLGQKVGVVNQGVPGETTPEGLNRLRRLMTADPRKVVLINEGTNDVTSLQDPFTIFQNLLAMTAITRDHDALPVLGTITPRTTLGFGGAINRRTDEVNEFIRTRAKGAALIVDLHAAFKGKYELYSNYIHPNADGYLYMAGVWFRGLIPVLNDLVEARDVERALDDAAAEALKPGRLARLQ